MILKCIRYITTEKSVVVERFIGTLKTKIYKYMISVSKKVKIDKLDDIVNEYNNTYHRTTKMMLKIMHILTLIEKLMIKTQNLKLVMMQELQNTKIFLLKDTLEAGLKKSL